MKKIKRPLIGDFGYEKYLWDQVSRKIDLIALETWKEFKEFNLHTIEHKLGFDGATKFRRHTRDFIKYLPHSPAVYFVFSQTDIIYIGETIDLYNRFKSHDYITHFRLYEARLITWINVDTHHLKHIENGFIHRLRPILNGIPQKILRDTSRF